MTAYHCDKLCGGACCAPLRWALDEWSVFANGAHFIANKARPEHLGPAITPERLDALRATDNPAKLAELLVLGGKARGVSTYGSLYAGPPIEGFIVFVRSDAIEVFGYFWSKKRTRHLMTPAQARTLLAAIMQTPPDELSREAVEALFRGVA